MWVSFLENGQKLLWDYEGMRKKTKSNEDSYGKRPDIWTKFGIN
jgi:hypothetical protein